jgi:hypothetical protein
LEQQRKTPRKSYSKRFGSKVTRPALKQMQLEYQEDLEAVFRKTNAEQFPLHRPYDHHIELLPSAAAVEGKDLIFWVYGKSLTRAFKPIISLVDFVRGLGQK